MQPYLGLGNSLQTAQGGGTLGDFADDYSNSAGWTLSADMSISSGVLNYTAVDGQQNSYKSLGITLSDTLWYADFDYNEASDTATDNHAWAVFCLTAGTGNPPNATQDGMIASVVENWTEYRWITQARDGSSIENTGQSTPHSRQGTQYYNRLLRTSATGNAFESFTNSDRTGAPFTSLTDTIVSTSALS